MSKTITIRERNRQLRAFVKALGFDPDNLPDASDLPALVPLPENSTGLSEQQGRAIFEQSVVWEDHQIEQYFLPYVSELAILGMIVEIIETIGAATTNGQLPYSAARTMLKGQDEALWNQIRRVDEAIRHADVAGFEIKNNSFGAECLKLYDALTAFMTDQDQTGQELRDLIAAHAGDYFRHTMEALAVRKTGREPKQGKLEAAQLLGVRRALYPDESAWSSVYAEVTRIKAIPPRKRSPEQRFALKYLKTITYSNASNRLWRLTQEHPECFSQKPLFKNS
jgi:hypothetical protein